MMQLPDKDSKDRWPSMGKIHCKRVLPCLWSNILIGGHWSPVSCLSA